MGSSQQIDSPSSFSPVEHAAKKNEAKKTNKTTTFAQVKAAVSSLSKKLSNLLGVRGFKRAVTPLHPLNNQGSPVRSPNSHNSTSTGTSGKPLQSHKPPSSATDQTNTKAKAGVSAYSGHEEALNTAKAILRSVNLDDSNPVENNLQDAKKVLLGTTDWTSLAKGALAELEAELPHEGHVLSPFTIEEFTDTVLVYLSMENKQNEQGKEQNQKTAPVQESIAAPPTQAAASVTSTEEEIAFNLTKPNFEINDLVEDKDVVSQAMVTLKALLSENPSLINDFNKEIKRNPVDINSFFSKKALQNDDWNKFAIETLQTIGIQNNDEKRDEFTKAIIDADYINDYLTDWVKNST